LKTGIILFGHGSTVASANEAVQTVAQTFARGGGYDEVEVAFLDCAPPTLAAAVATLAARGVTRIVVIPYFLTLGIHLQRDLPRIIAGLEGIHKGVQIEVTPPLDGHPALVEILLDRARASLPERNTAV
jgi:sirohydrochlorin ferrochelatase